VLRRFFAAWHVMWLYTWPLVESDWGDLWI
jgi:hypothetical protein